MHLCFLITFFLVVSLILHFYFTLALARSFIHFVCRSLACCMCVCVYMCLLFSQQPGLWLQYPRKHHKNGAGMDEGDIHAQTHHHWRNGYKEYTGKFAPKCARSCAPQRMAKIKNAMSFCARLFALFQRPHMNLARAPARPHTLSPPLSDMRSIERQQQNNEINNKIVNGKEELQLLCAKQVNEWDSQPTNRPWDELDYGRG